MVGPGESGFYVGLGLRVSSMDILEESVNLMWRSACAKFTDGLIGRNCGFDMKVPHVRVSPMD